MAWDTGTITSATPFVDLSQKIKDLCGDSGVANWSFVENIPAGTGTGQSGSSSYSLDVFKCAGSGTDANDSGTDWYFVFPVPSPTSGVSVANVCGAAEDYEGSTNKRFRRQMVRATVATAPTGSGYWFNDTLGSWNSLSSKLGMFSPTLNTTGFTYYVKLTNNGIFLAVRVGVTSTSGFVTLMDSLISPSVATDGCPLVGVDNNGFNAGYTRLPGVTDATQNKWNAGVFGWAAVLGSNSAATNVDFWQGGKVITSRLASGNRGGNGSMNLAGGLRGLLKADILAFQQGGTVQLGDTVTIDGNTWTVIHLAPTSIGFQLQDNGGSGLSVSTVSLYFLVRPI